MVVSILFGTIALALVVLLDQLIHYAREARRVWAITADERFTSKVNNHRWYARILLGCAIGIPITLFALAPILAREQQHVPPRVLILASRAISTTLIVTMMITLFWLNGLKKGRKALHRILGWAVVAQFGVLMAIGTVLLVTTYY